MHTKTSSSLHTIHILLQIVTSAGFGSSSGHDSDTMKATVAKWAFADDGIALSAPPFVQNKVAQLMAALAAVRSSTWTM